MPEIVIILLVVFAGVFLLRAFGAWMLRINEVIALLRDIKNLMKK